jgi:hypothetical protein
LLLFGYGCATPFNPFFAGVTHGQSLSEDNLNATVKLAYRFTDDVMGYASWGNGTKAGGFNLVRVNQSSRRQPSGADPRYRVPAGDGQLLRDRCEERARPENRARQCRRV